MPNNKIRIVDIALITYIISIFLFTAELDDIFISEIFFLIYTALVLLKIIRKNSGKISLHNVGYLLPLLIFAVVTVPLAMNRSLATEKVRTLLMLIALFILIYNTYLKEGNPNFILLGFLIGGSVLSVQVVSQYGLSIIGASLSTGRRIGKDILQLTYLGRYTYIAAIVALYFAYYKKIKPLYFAYVFCGFICVSSESRQSLITLIISTVLLFMMKDFSKKKIYSLLRVILVVAAIVFILRLPALQAISERLIAGLTLQQSQYVSTMSDTRRVEMLRQGLITFIHNPVFGIGLGGAREIVSGIISNYKYLHNNYVELLCCGGIIGFACYYSIYYFLFRKIHHINSVNGKNDEIIFATVLLIGQLFSDMFAVNYYGKIQYIIFAFCFVVLARGNSNRPIYDQ